MAEETVEGLQAQLATLRDELASTKARNTELIGENRGFKLNLQNTRADLDAAKAALDAAKADHSTALTAAEQKVTEATAAVTAAKTEAEGALATAKTASDQRIITAELKAAGLKAGLVDQDGLKLLDASQVTINEQGEVAIPKNFFEDAQKAKPWLFGKPGNTTNPNDPPKPGPTNPKTAATMTDAEFNEAVKNRVWRKTA